MYSLYVRWHRGKPWQLLAYNLSRETAERIARMLVPIYRLRREVFDAGVFTVHTWNGSEQRMTLAKWAKPEFRAWTDGKSESYLELGDGR